MVVTQQGVPGGVTTLERQKYTINAIRERHQASAEQILEPEFVIGRVICSQMLIGQANPDNNDYDNDDDDDDDDDAEIGNRNSEHAFNGKLIKEKRAHEYMYSYRIELLDSTGDKITGLLRPVLHKMVSHDGLAAGSVVKLREWRAREAVGRNGSEFLLVCHSISFYCCSWLIMSMLM